MEPNMDIVALFFYFFLLAAFGAMILGAALKDRTPCHDDRKAGRTRAPHGAARAGEKRFNAVIEDSKNSRPA